MTGIKDKFYFSDKYHSAHIANSSFMVGDGIVRGTSLLTIKNIFFIPKYPISFLFIS